jgi:hypothetical protein
VTRQTTALRVLALAGGVVLLILVAGLAYQAGNRAGRGATCFEVAVHTPDQAGQTLNALFLNRPGSKFDYTFWGTHCTISIGWRPDGRADRVEGGRWAYFPGKAKLFAQDDTAGKVFPAEGRWP